MLKPRIRINVAALGVYAFGFLLVYLAGMSLSGVLQFALLVYLIFPALSFVLLVIVFARFRYYENFSNEHPAKGEEVVYSLSLANESLFSDARVCVRFKLMSPDTSLTLAPLNASVRRRKTRKEIHRIKFSYRGIYKVGIDFIEIFDSLGWLRYRPPVWFRTFYVYPRVIELRSVFPALQNVIETSGSGQGIISDYTLYKELREYRDGSPVKHMAWKKFATTGTPFLRDYEKTSWPGVEIYLDLRREREADPLLLEREDCSVEILVALVNFFLKSFVPVTVHAYNGRDRFDFSGNDPALFGRFYKSTITITFGGDLSPVCVFNSDMQDRLIAAGTVIFITHSLDPDLLELVLGSGRSDLSIFSIANHTGADPEQRKRDLMRVQAESASRGNIVFVESAQTIRENIET